MKKELLLFCENVKPTLVARSVVHLPAEFKVAGSIPGQGHQQCWVGKYFSHAPSSVMLSRGHLVEILTRV